MKNIFFLAECKAAKIKIIKCIAHGIVDWDLVGPWQVGLRLIQDPYPFTGPLAWLTGGGLGVIQVPYQASCQVEAAPRQPKEMAWQC